MAINTKILVGIIVLIFLGVTVFLVTQPNDFVKTMTSMEKTQSESLSNLAETAEIPLDSVSESHKTEYIKSLDGLYNSSLNFKKSLEAGGYPEQYKEYVNAQIAFMDVYLLTINNTKQYYLTGDEFYADLVITTNKTVKPPHISDYT